MYQKSGEYLPQCTFISVGILAGQSCGISDTLKEVYINETLLKKLICNLWFPPDCLVASRV
jgi:hypothetical protein